MREDTFTNTVEAAAAYEQLRGGGYSRYPDDAPTRAEAEYDAMLDRQEEARRRKVEDEARARGEYVPNGLTKMTASVVSMTLTQRGLLGCRVVPVRDGVFWVDGVHDLEHPVWSDGTFDPEHYEVRLVDGTVWMKGESWYRDPWSGHEHKADEPPF